MHLDEKIGVVQHAMTQRKHKRMRHMVTSAWTGMQ